MRKMLIAGLAAMTFAGAAMPAAEAAARDRRYYRHHRGDNDDAIIAGVAGLAIGAALASGGHRRDYYDGGYLYDRRRPYERGYYGRPYGYYAPRPYYADYGGYRRCRTTTNWDPWSDAYIRRTECW